MLKEFKNTMSDACYELTKNLSQTQKEILTSVAICVAASVVATYTVRTIDSVIIKSTY